MLSIGAFGGAKIPTPAFSAQWERRDTSALTTKLSDRRNEGNESKRERGRRFAEARGLVRVGDRYHRKDKHASVEVVRVTETHVEWEVSQDGNSWRETAPMERFLELERKSLEWGAEFEPAPNAPHETRRTKDNE